MSSCATKSIWKLRIIWESTFYSEYLSLRVTFCSTPPLRGMAENCTSFPLNQQRAVTNSHWQLQIKLVSTQQKGRAGTKDTAALSPGEKQLVNGHRGKLSTLPRCCFTSQSSSTDVRGSFCSSYLLIKDSQYSSPGLLLRGSWCRFNLALLKAGGWTTRPPEIPSTQCYALPFSCFTPICNQHQLLPEHRKPFCPLGLLYLVAICQLSTHF